MNVLGFFHTYAQDGEFGSFMLELIKGFENSGINLHVIKANDLVDNLSAHSYSDRIDVHKLEELIKSLNPAFIFSTNHAGIGKVIKKKYKHIPVVTWMVDRNPFLHSGYELDKLFSKQDYVITSSTANVEKLEKRFPILENKVVYLPFMTNPNSFNHSHYKDINISFVGSVFVNTKIIVDMFKNNLSNMELRTNLCNFIKDVEKNYDLDLKETIDKYKLKRVIKDNNLTNEKFLGIIANMISNNKRFLYLGSIADLGLHLFGTKNWHSALKVSPRLVSRFHFNTFIKTREQLCNVYDRSKISLNINHHQATTGLGYRVFDIMASSSLLISNYQKESDLEVLFGKNHPIPIYKDEIELRDLVQFYLNHEDERVKIVQQCNDLIKDMHTFEKRAVQIVQIIDSSFEGKKEIQPAVFYEQDFFLKINSELVNIQKELTPLERKLRKLKKDPQAFLRDSKILKIFRS